MSDWIDANLYEAWLWLLLAALAIAYGVVALVHYADSRRPLTRSERRHLKTVRTGKRAQGEGR